MIEKVTDEWRVLKRKVVPGTFTGIAQGEVVISVQRKWLVENGNPYSPADFGPPDSPHDLFIGMLNGRPTWQPMKEEWRDLPSVLVNPADE